MYNITVHRPGSFDMIEFYTLNYIWLDRARTKARAGSGVVLKSSSSCRRVRDTATAAEGFDELGEDFERDNSVACGKIGAADARLFKLGDAVNYAQRCPLLKRSHIT